MALDTDTVRRIARLARIHIPGVERKALVASLECLARLGA